MTATSSASAARETAKQAYTVLKESASEEVFQGIINQHGWGARNFLRKVKEIARDSPGSFVHDQDSQLVSALEALKLVTRNTSAPGMDTSLGSVGAAARFILHRYQGSPYASLDAIVHSTETRASDHASGSSTPGSSRQ